MTKSGERRLERSNYATDQNRNFWNQRILDGFPDLPRVVVGYELLREMTDVRVYVAYPKSTGRGFCWSYVMPDQNDTVIQLEADHRAYHSDGDEEDKGFAVHPRRRLLETGTDA